MELIKRQRGVYVWLEKVPTGSVYQSREEKDSGCERNRHVPKSEVERAMQVTAQERRNRQANDLKDAK